MSLEVQTLDSVQIVVQGPDPSVLRLGLLVPLSGSLGLTGPSALNAASLAVAEVNAAGGVLGKALVLALLDAGRNPLEVAGLAGSLAEAGLVDAFVGFHTSDVHRAVEQSLGGRTPYIFTPPHEAAVRLGVTQPRISDLVRGKIDLFSLDSLVNMVAAAGLHVEMSVEQAA